MTLFCNDLRTYSEGGNRLLCTIHDLDIRDKHKLLVPLARITAVVDMVMEDDTGKSTEGAVWGTISNVLPITVPIPAISKMKVKDYGRLAFDVVFDQGSRIRFCLYLVRRSEQFREVTLGTIEAMEGFFRERSHVRVSIFFGFFFIAFNKVCSYFT